MINFTKNISVFFLVLAMALSTARADDADTPAADTAAPAPDAALGPEPAPPASSISYTGAWLSAVIPGTGQVYHKNYLMGAGFLTADVIAAVVSLNRWGHWIELRDESKDTRKMGWEIKRGGAANRDSIAGVYSVLADRTEFEARYSKYTAYNAFAWTVGIYYYNVMDALERGGVTARGSVKSPMTAGLLAAVPFFGLGQLYNGRPGKAGMMSMTQASLAAIAINNHRLMDHASGKYNEMRDPASAQFIYGNENLAYWKGRYDNAFSQRNTYLWVSLFAYLYTIFDAVVDAHLSDYDERIRLGPDLSVGAGGGGVSFDLSVGF